MKLSRERKIFVILLGIGICAFLADRLRAGAESASEPANIPPTAITPRPAATDCADKALTHSPEPFLTQRIRQAAARLPAQQAPRDAFRIAPAWSGVDAAGSGARESVTTPDALQFQRSHRLTGVIKSGRRSGAIVDGKLVTIGQAVAGYRLVEVAEGQAVFEGHERRVVLRLEEPGQ